MSIDRLDVSTPQGPAGVLAREASGYVFAYGGHAAPQAAVSLTMPPRLQAYERPELHPVFQMNLPEGYLLERLKNLLAKTSGTDPMVLLALLGGGAPIGRVRFAAAASAGVAAPSSGAGPMPGERLTDILAYRGAGGLFDSLIDRYLTRSALSGVQPKVLVPEASPQAPSKAAAFTSDLIVKSGLGEFPGLAINEFLCMSAAQRAGMPVPAFYLSDDRTLFVMRRFDRTEEGRAIGFEDMAVLSGKGAGLKYSGRYEDIARLIGAFCSPEHVAPSLAQLFDIVALSCIVGNGDAHLKNFGLLYDTPEDAPVRLAPAFDIASTTCYLPEDALALTLSGSKSLFASRLHLLDFADRCRIARARAGERLLELCDAVAGVLSEHAGLAAEVPGFEAAVRKGVDDFRVTFRQRGRGAAS
ncbi:type II toxin-antitoxin system HipA family toxin [Aquincola sp. MAHUQ-54]|uniref:Type II toxin-antitoxin system HipA family toxin n=1 Tax=Aquincola agrisoli TaxID=3119538 RepID=A0AAW9QKJ2_9BURK